MNVSLRTKATLLATVLVLVLLATVGLLQTSDMASDYRELLRAQQEALAESVADDLADKLAIHMSALEQTGKAFDQRLLDDPTGRQELLSRITGTRALFDGVGLVDPAGLVIANEPVRSPAARVEIADREYFRRVIDTGQSTISRPIQARTGDGAIVMLSVPIRNDAGALIAVIAGALKLHHGNLFGQLASATVGRTGHFEVVTRGDNPIYVVHPDPARVLGPDESSFVPANDLVTRKIVRGVDWELRVVLPGWEAEAPVLASKRRLFWQLLALGCTAALLAWFAMRWLLQPLATLHATIRHLRNTPGAPLNVDTSTHDERGDLAREFVGLMHELNSRQAELSAVVDASPLGFFRTDAQGHMTYANDAYLRMHGLAREDIRKGWLTMLQPGSRELAWAGWQAIVQRRESFATVRTMTRADGKELLLSIRSSPLIAEGRLEGHVGTVADITQRAAAEKAVRLLSAIFDATPDYVVQTDAWGNISYMNPAARRAANIALDASLRGRNVAEFNTSETNARFATEIVPAVKEHGVWVGETTILVADRRSIPVSHMVFAHRNRHGHIDHFSAVMRDISGELEAKRAIQRQTATLRSVTEAIPAIVAVIGADTRVRFVNSGFERWHGQSRDKLIGLSLRDVLGRTEFERSRPYMERVLAGETVSFEKTSTGHDSGVHLAISFIPLWQDDGAIDGFISVAQDITEHRQEHSRLLQLTRKDVLTGLLNRAGFEKFLEDRVNAGEGAGLALLYIDLDHFKTVNDRHGHPVGDQLLQMFGHRLRALVRPTDAVARLGGDEFAIVLSDVREEVDARMVADKILTTAREFFEVGSLRLSVGASVGVAFGLRAPGDWRDLVARADGLLYRAKESGRGQLAIASGATGD